MALAPEKLCSDLMFLFKDLTVLIVVLLMLYKVTRITHQKMVRLRKEAGPDDKDVSISVYTFTGAKRRRNLPRPKR